MLAPEPSPHGTIGAFSIAKTCTVRVVRAWTVREEMSKRHDIGSHMQVCSRLNIGIQITQHLLQDQQNDHKKRSPHGWIIITRIVYVLSNHCVAFSVLTEFTVVTVRGGGYPRGLPLVTRVLASSEQAWEPMASSIVNFCRKARTVPPVLLKSVMAATSCAEPFDVST